MSVEKKLKDLKAFVDDKLIHMCPRSLRHGVAIRELNEVKFRLDAIMDELGKESREIKKGRVEKK